MEKEDFNHNLRRKVEAMDLPESMTVRLKSEMDALKFEKKKKKNDSISGNHGNQKTFEFILELAWQKLRELEEKEKEMEMAST